MVASFCRLEILDVMNLALGGGMNICRSAWTLESFIDSLRSFCGVTCHILISSSSAF